MRSFVLPVLAVCAALALTGPAHADPVDPVPPQLGDACSADLADAMTLLPDQRTYALCQPAGDGFAWAAAPVPFEPQQRWYSYGPVITLHGQGMRNPNVIEGDLTATPRTPETVCRAGQQTVVEAGVLSAPEVAQGEPGRELSVRLQPRLFYLELSGDCLWDQA